MAPTSTNEGEASTAIVIPEEWSSDLQATAVSNVEAKVLAINSGYFRNMSDTATALVEIKNSIPEGNWIKFTESDLLPIGSRTILDLVRSQPLLVTWADKLDQALVGSMATRAVSMIAGVKEKADTAEDEKVKEEAAATLRRIEDRLKQGTRLTVTQVSQELGKVRQQKKQTSSKKELEEKLAIAKQVQMQLEEDGDMLKKDKTELQVKVAELEKRLAVMEADLNTFRRLSGQAVGV